jgi:TatD DNase family protein
MEPKYFDVHAHVNFKAYEEDRDAVISRALDAGVYMMNVGTQQDTSREAVELAEKYASEGKTGLYAAIALHPVHTSKSHHDEKELGGEGKAFTSRGEEFDSNFYEELARHDVVKAIGECGLDYYRLEEDTARLQKEVFIKHIEVANKVNKPLMLHIRNGAHQGSGDAAYKDAIEILKQYSKVKGDVHFFAGTWEVAQEFLALGFTLSFTGVVTFTKDYDEVVRNTPLDMILSETDCPYITPTPFRGKRNEPMHVREIVKAIARIKELDEEVVRAQLVTNAKRVFNF